jgi:phosphomannomutase
MAERDDALSAVVAERPDYRIVKRKVDRGGLDVPTLLDSIGKAAPDGVLQDSQDGLRLAWPDGSWIHVRPSGTEPILRIVAEAQQEQAALELADWVERRVRARE